MKAASREFLEYMARCTYTSPTEGGTLLTLSIILSSVKVQFWGPTHRKHGFVTFETSDAARRAKENATANADIHFTVYPVIDNAWGKYELPPVTFKAQLSTPPRTGLPSKPPIPLGPRVHARTASGSSPLNFNATHSPPTGPSNQSPYYTNGASSNSTPRDNLLRETLDAMKKENTTLKTDLQSEKDDKEKMAAEIRLAIADNNRLREERDRARGRFELASEDAKIFHEQRRETDDELVRREWEVIDLKRRLQTAIEDKDYYRYQLGTKERTIKDLKLQLYDTNRKLKAVDQVLMKAGHSEEGEIAKEEELSSPVKESSEDVQMDVERYEAVMPALQQAFLRLDQITTAFLQESKADQILTDGPTRKKRKLDES